MNKRLADVTTGDMLKLLVVLAVIAGIVVAVIQANRLNDQRQRVINNANCVANTPIGQPFNCP